jgi:Cft2 family RNA processing exonuclease
MIPYHIISTGSQGNAVILHDHILIDCGVSYHAIDPFVPQIKLVLLTHIHGDHFRPSTLHRLSAERPTVRFACCRWLVSPLLAAGIPSRSIDALEPDVTYDYRICRITPIALIHNVPNCGYKIHFPEGKVFYATDTNNLNGIVAKNYDLYMVEANYEDAEIQARIAEKREAGEYAYEMQVLKNHLSKAKCDDWIYQNIGQNGEYVYLHGHRNNENGGGDKC